jgi:hypothetical protein
MNCSKLENVGNHEGHVLNVAKYNTKVNIECVTCQEVILTLKEGKEGELKVKENNNDKI